MSKLKVIFTRRFKKPIYKTFTKCLLYLFIVCIVASIASCSCDYCTYEEEKYPAYANKSDEIVKIVTIGVAFDGERNYEKIIADGDTLHSYADKELVYHYDDRDCGLVSLSDCNKPIRMELHFFGESEKCLIFDGPIKHDGIDMRSWKSYKKGNELDLEDNWGGWVDMEYVYTITPEHKAMAKDPDSCRIEDK